MDARFPEPVERSRLGLGNVELPGDIWHPGQPTGRCGIREFQGAQTGPEDAGVDSSLLKTDFKLLVRVRRILRSVNGDEFVSLVQDSMS